MSRYHELIKNDPRWHSARRACLERDGYVCTVAGCGIDYGLQVDHVIPLSVLIPNNGNPFDLDNLKTLCGPHNASKGATMETPQIRIKWINPKYLTVIAAAPADQDAPFF